MTVQFGFSLQGRGGLADRETITQLAQRAEALGYDSVWVTDRLLIPVQRTTAYPYSPTGTFFLGADESWLEPLIAVTYLATITQRIHVGTSVLVIPYRNPVVTAKALATADYLSGGRIILGAGIGWWREEFATLGVRFEERAAMTAEYLRVMKAIWTQPRIAFEGQFTHITEAGGVQPHPARKPHIPIWIGGHSVAALRRAATLGDGWHPLGLRPPVALFPAEMRDRVHRLRELVAAAGRDPAAITISFKAPLTLGSQTSGPWGARTPLSGPPAKLAEDIGAYVAAGVEHFVFDFPVPARHAMFELMEQFAANVRPRVGA